MRHQAWPGGVAGGKLTAFPDVGGLGDKTASSWSRVAVMALSRKNPLVFSFPIWGWGGV